MSFRLPIRRLSGYLDLIWMGTTLTDEPRMVRIAEYFVVGLLGSERLESIQAISWRTRGSSMSERFDSVELLELLSSMAPYWDSEPYWLPSADWESREVWEALVAANEEFGDADSSCNSELSKSVS